MSFVAAASNLRSRVFQVIVGVSSQRNREIYTEPTHSTFYAPCIYLFHGVQIPVQSQYEAKGTAGNIIPAIATTNAIIAGLQVVF